MTSNQLKHAKEDPQPLRLTELLMAIALATDLGTGQPMGHAFHTCCVGVTLAKELGCSQEEIGTVHQVALLRFLGCTADATELAKVAGGDDRRFVANMSPVAMGNSRESIKQFIRSLGPDQTLPRRLSLIVRGLTDPGGAGRAMTTHCEVASLLTRRLQLGESVVDALAHGFERWDGNGYPDGLRGEEIPLATRVAIVARDADLFFRSGHDPTVQLQERSGHAYDPAVVAAFLDAGPSAIQQIEEGDEWIAVLDNEPSPVAFIHDDKLDVTLNVFADFTDLKSPWLRGHSPAVADMAEAAAKLFGLEHDQCHQLRQAGLLHDIGRVGVPNGIWDKAGSLTTTEWEQVRLHPYYTRRILERCRPLQLLSEPAASHHERLDGSGYDRGIGEHQLSISARILAASDVFIAATADRPYRPAMTRDQAAKLLEAETQAGRLDANAVAAVLAAAGMRTDNIRHSWPADLTDREVEVLRLIARGKTNHETAELLFISPKTVGRHVENIYRKIDVSTRAGAAVFAMEHRLLD